MKKALPLLILSAASLLFSSMASAAVYSDTKGENPCLFTLSNLQNHGFSQDKIYTAEQIHQLLNSSAVDTSNIDDLAPGSYQLSYSCYVDNHLARVTLQAVPVDGSKRIVNNITWKATKPAAQ